MRIAVIEDNADVALYLETFLIQEGHEAVVVTGHFDRLLHDDFWWGIDVAIVDLLLNHDVNGGHILAWLVEHQPRIRRVVLSAVANHVDVKELAHAVLVKPAGAIAIRRAIAGGGGLDSG